MLRGSVVLNAVPTPGSAFAGWHTEPPTTCHLSRDDRCEMTVDGAIEVKAFFVTNGANLWVTPVGGAGLSWGKSAALENDGSSYAIGQFNDAIQLVEEKFVSRGESDIFVVELDENGSIGQRRVFGSQTEDSVHGVTLTPAGPVFVGEIGAVARYTELEPLGIDSYDGQDAFVVALDFELSLRWKWSSPTPGWAAFNHVASDELGRVFALGRYDGELLLQSGWLWEELPAALLLALDSDGNERWSATLRSSGYVTELGLGLQSTGEIVLSGAFGDDLDLNERGGSCDVGGDLNLAFVARMSSEGACLAARTFGPTQAYVSIAGDDAVVVKGEFEGSRDFSEGLDPERGFASAGNERAVFVMRLGADLSWKVGESWVTPISGAGKLHAFTAADDGVLLGLHALSDVQIEEHSLQIDESGRVLFAKLGADGELVWARAHGAPANAAVSGLTWHAPTHTWFASGEYGVPPPDESVLLDFGNVTQAPVEVRSKNALFARFAP